MMQRCKIFLIHSGVYILQNTMARGGGIKMVPGKKMKNEAVRKKKEKGEKKKEKEKRGKEKEEKAKGESDFFLLIYGTLLLIIVYQRNIS